MAPTRAAVPRDPGIARDSPPTIVGTAVGHYLVMDPLGEGGMGRVYRAFDRHLDRAVALKMLRRGVESEYQRRLVREAKALAQLSHPNVVQVHEVGTWQGQTFVAMELVPGKTLRRWLQRVPRPDWRACVEVYLQAGAGLAAAHEKGLVHRDFKPSNVVIDDRGRVRVLDFGLARSQSTTSESSGDPESKSRSSSPVLARGHLDSGARLTETGLVLGTPAYMSPEQMHDGSADARSDQFSFCVSLYEAVYGRRPFAGRSFEQRQDKIRKQEFSPVPPEIKVPARLRAALVRGLATAPEDRWPSIEALLGELQRLVAPRWRGRWALGAGLALGLTALGTARTYQARVALQTEQLRHAVRAERCSGASAELSGVWDDPRRRQVEAAILGTALPYALQTWRLVESGLDDYAEAWARTYTAVCEATVVRKEQTEAQMGLRMSCLRRRQVALRAAVDVLARVDVLAVPNATKLVTGLPPLHACDDVAVLERHQRDVPPPEEPEVARQVEALRDRLSDIEAETQAGGYARALKRVQRVVEQARASGYAPVHAEALLRRGRVWEANARYAEAEVDLERAFTLAATHGHDAVAAAAVTWLVWVVGAQQARYESGRTWAKAALALSQGEGVEPEVFARALNHLGHVLRKQGELDQALTHHQRAQEIEERALGPEHAHVATTLASIGLVLRQQGQLDEALDHHQRALAIDQQTLGPQHPYLASTLSNMGNVLHAQGRLDEALDHHRRALAIEERALGSEHPDLASTLTNIGVVLDDLGRLDEALEHHRRAQAIDQEARGSEHPSVARALINIGVVLEEQGQLGEALEHYRRALGIFEQALGTEHAKVAITLTNMGALLRKQDQLDEAREHYRRALGIFEHALGPEHPMVAHPLLGLSRLSEAAGDHASARTYAERTLVVREAAQVAPALLADARFALARVLWRYRSERTRARSLAVQARDAYARAGEGREDDLAEAEAWLTVHR